MKDNNIHVIFIGKSRRRCFGKDITNKTLYSNGWNYDFEVKFDDSDIVLYYCVSIYEGEWDTYTSCGLRESDCNRYNKDTNYTLIYKKNRDKIKRRALKIINDGNYFED